jgi:hypothetical protein
MPGGVPKLYFLKNTALDATRNRSARRLCCSSKKHAQRRRCSGEETYIAPDYLVVEVALYPPKGETTAVELSDFALRINGKKTLLTRQAPSMVAAGLNRPQRQSERLRATRSSAEIRARN